MPFNPQKGSQQDISQQGYTELRVLKGERRGKFFKSPISKFIGTTGAASTGAQITFRIAFNKGVQSVQLLRNASKDPGSAKVLTVYQLTPVSQAAVAVNKDTTFHDSDPATFAATVNYFLRVIPLHTNFQPIVIGPLTVAVP